MYNVSRRYRLDCLCDIYISSISRVEIHQLKNRKILGLVVHVLLFNMLGKMIGGKRGAGSMRRLEVSCKIGIGVLYVIEVELS